MNCSDVAHECEEGEAPNRLAVITDIRGLIEAAKQAPDRASVEAIAGKALGILSEASRFNVMSGTELAELDEAIRQASARLASPSAA